MLRLTCAIAVVIACGPRVDGLVPPQAQAAWPAPKLLVILVVD
jgi:hypothetical protein